MQLDFDTFLVALYTIVDDLYRARFALAKPNRPGSEPRFSDSEVLTILLCGQWFGRSERESIRHARIHWRDYFPKLLSQGQMNRRSRDLAGVLVQMVPLVASELEAELAAYQVLDGLPVALMRRCRGKRHKLFGDEADVGKGGADKDFYYGVQLLLCVTPQGIITGFIMGPASTNIRWLAEDFLCWRSDRQGVPWKTKDLPPSNKRKGSHYVGPRGPIWPREGVGEAAQEPYIADAGFSGPIWTDHWAADYQALVITPMSYPADGAEALRAEQRRWRHVIETVNGHLEEALHLLFPKARSRWGLLTRIAAKLLAFNLAILINRLFGRDDFAVATLFS